MIVEAAKIILSIYPFIKEAFLWRDGAAAGKPITNEHLARRKLATFVLLFSLIANFLLFKDLTESRKKEEALTKKVSQLQAAPVVTLPNNCISPAQLFDLVDAEIAQDIAEGKLKRVTPHQKPHH